MLKKNNAIIIIKYIFSSGTSFLIDLILFTIFNIMFIGLGNISIIVSTILARIISSLYNYFFNSRLVFGKYNKSSIYKYYGLVLIQMINSAIFVYLLCFIFSNVNETIIKFFVDLIIFIINYIIQKQVIFK